MCPQVGHRTGGEGNLVGTLGGTFGGFEGFSLIDCLDDLVALSPFFERMERFAKSTRYGIPKLLNLMSDGMAAIGERYRSGRKSKDVV